jgi:hypothetical protein
MEQAALYDVASALENPWPTVDDGHAVTRNIPTLRCPSDTFGTGSALIDAHRQAVCNFIVNRGDTTTHDGPRTGADGYAPSRGVFYFDEERTFGFIQDGTSNTFLISETVISLARGTRDVRGGIVVIGGGLLDTGNWTHDPNPCLNAPKSGRTFTGEAVNRWRNARILDGRVMYTAFNTILPPNAMSCVWANSENCNGFYTANSNHTGGVNTARVDGSVAFVSDSVNTGGLPSTRQGRFLQGESPYGVWGALGTPQGGESRSL